MVDSPDDERLPFLTKAVLGIGSSAIGVNIFVGGFYLNNFFLELACLEPAYVGLIQGLQCCFDAANDPLLGYLSDRTRTRFGRRRPWLLFAGPFAAVSYVCLFQTMPLDTPEALRVVYHLATYMAMSVAMTCIEVQLNALVPELTSNYDERTTLTAYRVLFSNIIGTASVVVHMQIIAFVTPILFAYQISAVVFGFLMWSFTWITFFCIKERSLQMKKEPMAFVAGLRLVCSNRAFACVCLMYTVGPMAVATMQSNLVMYGKYVLQSEELIATLLPVVLLTAQLSIPVWVKLSSCWNKRHAAMVGYMILMVCMIILPLIPKDATPLIILDGIGIGSSLSVPYLLPHSMLPDVIEDDELRSGERREGVFAGFFTTPLKLAVALSLTCTNAMLKVAGYEAPQSLCGASGASADLLDSQPEDVLRVLGFLVGPIPASFLALGILATFLFPISRESHKELLAQVEAARCAAAATKVGKTEELERFGAAAITGGAPAVAVSSIDTEIKHSDDRRKLEYKATL